MAQQNNLFNNLKRLFSTDVVIRNVGGDNLKIIDVNKIQTTGKLQTNSLVDRFNRIYTNSQTSLYGRQSNFNYQYLRPSLYSDYDSMDTDAIIASSLDIIADESTLKNDMGEVLSIKSSDEEVQKVLYNLFYDVLNIEFNLWPWVRNMCKYGDFFLKLEIAEKFGVYNVIPYTAFHIERVEGPDEEDGQITKFRFDPEGIASTSYGFYNVPNQDNDRGITFDNYEMAHFRLLTDVNFLPYGRCLAPESRIYTENSHKEIQDIKKGDKVRTFNLTTGTYELAEVLNTINSGVKSIFSVKTSHNEVRGSDNHPILIWDTLNNEPKYEQIKNLKVGDYVVHYNNPERDKIENPKLTKELPTLNKYDWKTNLNPLETFPEDIDNEFSRFWGFMLGDGYISNTNYSVGFACGEVEIQNEYYKNLLLKYSGVETLNINYNKNSKLDINGYYVNSKIFKHLMGINGYEGKSYSKRFPKWIFECNRETQLSFVKGLMDADGYIFEDKWGCKSYNITLANKKMLEDLKILLDINNIKTGSIRPRKHTGKVNILGKEYNTRQSYDFTFYLEGKEKLQPKKFNKFNLNFNIELYKIKSITEELPEETYDIQVSKNSNFISDGIIVHNSYIEPARKLFKQYSLMEDAMLMHRIVRAPEKRIHYMNIGSIPPNEVEAFMEQTVSKMKRTPHIDEESGEYNLKYNLENILEDYYIPVRGNDTSTKIETLNGLQWDGIDDVKYLREKLFAALKIPKAFMGYDEDTDGKATLASQDMRFARTIERIQRIITSELYKIAVIHLYSQGYRKDQLNNFELSLTNPSIIYDQERVELLKSKVELATNAVESGMFPTDWVYNNVFNLSEEEYNEFRDLIDEDAKRKFKKNQIESEGNDPYESGKTYGTPHDLASLYGRDRFANSGNVPDGYDEESPKKGRPKEKSTNINTQDSNFGKDRLGAQGAKNDYNDNGRLNPNANNNKNTLSLETKYKDMIKSLSKNKKGIIHETSGSFLDESNLKE